MAAITSCIAGVFGGFILLLIMHLAARFTGFDANPFDWPVFLVGWFGSAYLIYKA